MVLRRPDWWHPGFSAPLPAPSAVRVYSGTGKIGEGGKVWSQLIPVEWETVEQWKARTT